MCNTQKSMIEIIRHAVENKRLKLQGNIQAMSNNKTPGAPYCRFTRIAWGGFRERGVGGGGGWGSRPLTNADLSLFTGFQQFFWLALVCLPSFIIGVCGIAQYLG